MPTEESLQTAPGSGDTEVARQPRHITDIFHPNVCKTTLSDAVAMGAPKATATGVALPPPPGLHSLSTSLAKDESPGEVAPGVEPFSSECVLFVGVPRTLFCCLWQAPLLPRENMAGNGTQLLMRMRGGRDGNNADLRCCPLAVTSDAMQHGQLAVGWPHAVCQRFCLSLLNAATATRRFPSQWAQRKRVASQSGELGGNGQTAW
jgi:hypothetical protein